jgi:predicted nucleic acid-binding protein
MENLILVDSNILIYSLDDKSPKCEAARGFLERKSLKLVLCHQALLETYRVVTHRIFPNPYTPREAFISLASISKQRVVVYPRKTTFKITQKLTLKHKISSNKVFDVYLTATAIDWGIKYIATDNERDFKKFSEIKVLNPFK